MEVKQRKSSKKGEVVPDAAEEEAKNPLGLTLWKSLVTLMTDCRRIKEMEV